VPSKKHLQLGEDASARPVGRSTAPCRYRNASPARQASHQRLDELVATTTRDADRDSESDRVRSSSMCAVSVSLTSSPVRSCRIPQPLRQGGAGRVPRPGGFSSSRLAAGACGSIAAGARCGSRWGVGAAACALLPRHHTRVLEGSSVDSFGALLNSASPWRACGPRR